MKTLCFYMIAISVSLALIAFLQPVHAQNVPSDKNATLIVNFNSSKFSGYQGGPFTPSHDGSMYAFSTSIVDPKSHDWKSSLWLYFMKNGTTRSLDLNSDLSQISYVSFSADDKKLLFVGNGCDSDPSHTTFYVFNLIDIHLKCNGLTNVHDADWMPDGSIIFLQNNEENDTISIYQNGTQKPLYTKQITPPYISLNSSHIESIKASPDGKKIALWYFVMLSHKTQILDVADGKITDTFDGGHPKWGQNSSTLLYSLPIGTGYYDKGPRSVITYINLLDVDKNKTTTIDSIPVGVDDLFLSANGSKAFYVAKVPSVYDFLNFTSGVYEIDLNHNEVGKSYLADIVYPLGQVGLQSPLKQFKSGIKVEDVKCSSNLHLIIKAEDGSFACVSIETGKQLALRGWATTFGTGMIVNDYTISCDTAYPRSDSGIAVLYMPTNSVGKVCVRYHNLNNTPTIVGDRIFDANNIASNASDVTTWANTNTLQGNDNATIVYSIKTGNKTGLYGLSLTCGGIPLAVGYDANSTITTSDFPWANQAFHCGVITYDYYIEGTKGIGVRYIPDSSAGQIGK